MSHIVRREPREMIGDALVRIRQHERSAAQNSAKINLHAAIAADVVKSPPRGGAVGGARCVQRRREAREIVHDHFGNAGRPRGHQHPFGATQLGRVFRHGGDRGFATDWSWEFKHRQRRRFVINDRGVGLGRSGDRGQMTGLNARRQDHDAPRNTVKFDQSQRGVQLIVDRKQNRAPGQRRKSRAKDRTTTKIGEANRSFAIPNPPIAGRRGYLVAQRGFTAGHARRLLRSRRA